MSTSLETAEIIACHLAKLQATSLKPGQGQYSSTPLFTPRSLRVSVLRPRAGEMTQGKGKGSGVTVLAPTHCAALAKAEVVLTVIFKHCSFSFCSGGVTRCYTRLISAKLTGRWAAFSQGGISVSAWQLQEPSRSGERGESPQPPCTAHAIRWTPVTNSTSQSPPGQQTGVSPNTTPSSCFAAFS